MLKLIHINFKGLVIVCFLILTVLPGKAQPGTKETGKTSVNKKNINRILYGQASYYAAKFEGRKTATGEIFKHSKFTAACNVLPLKTWIRVTNLKNGKFIIVQTNDRLHPKTRRILDLTKAGAQKLGYIKSGLTRVKIEVLKHKPG